MLQPNSYGFASLLLSPTRQRPNGRDLAWQRCVVEAGIAAEPIKPLDGDIVVRAKILYVGFAIVSYRDGDASGAQRRRAANRHWSASLIDESQQRGVADLDRKLYNHAGAILRPYLA